jgi:predicted Zn-dependent protease
VRRLAGWRLWVLASLGLGVTGCGIAPPMNEALPRQQASSGPQQPLAGSPANPAVVALLDTAQTQQLAGNYEQAAAALERALRLEPRNAMLWHRLAQVRLSQGQWRNAIDLAAKSNSLAGGQRDLQASNWLVIAQAKERQGDREGAQAARAQAEAGGALPVDGGVR